MLKKQNFMIQLLNRLFLFKPEVSGSDAHISAAIGVGYTAFEGKGIKSLKLSLIEGQTIACSNPWKFLTMCSQGKTIHFECWLAVLLKLRTVGIILAESRIDTIHIAAIQICTR